MSGGLLHLAPRTLYPRLKWSDLPAWREVPHGYAPVIYLWYIRKPGGRTYGLVAHLGARTEVEQPLWENAVSSY